MSSDDPFDDIFDAIDGLVDDLFGSGGDGPRPIVDARGVRIDVQERDDGVEVVADLPSGAPGEVELECDGEVLRIVAGEHDSRVELPVSVDETSADASLNNGILSVTFEPAGRDGPKLP